jgi:hypothetical protein
MHYASQTSSIMMGKVNKSHAKCLAGNPHYGAIAKWTTKAAVISKVQVIGPKLHLYQQYNQFSQEKD